MDARLPSLPDAPPDNGLTLYPDFAGLDYYALDDLLTDAQKGIREDVRAFVSAEVTPIIEAAAQEMVFPRHLAREFGRLGVIGPSIPPNTAGAASAASSTG